MLPRAAILEAALLAQERVRHGMMKHVGLSLFPCSAFIDDSTIACSNISRRWRCRASDLDMQNDMNFTLLSLAMYSLYDNSKTSSL